MRFRIAPVASCDRAYDASVAPKVRQKTFENQEREKTTPERIVRRQTSRDSLNPSNSRVAIKEHNNLMSTSKSTFVRTVSLDAPPVATLPTRGPVVLRIGDARSYSAVRLSRTSTIFPAIRNR